jgi:hypothetical protein
LRFQHAQIPPFRAFQTSIRETFSSSRRTTRLATVTAAAVLAAVGAGVTASPAMAATAGSSKTTLTAARTPAAASTGSAASAASDAGAFRLGTESTAAPLGHVPASASHQTVAPIAQPAPAGPLSPLAPTSAPSQAAGQAQVASATAGDAAAQKPAAAAPAPAPAPAPQPYQFYDSVTPQMIPAGQLVATYATGGYAVPASQVAGRGNVLWIDTRGTDPGAQALDVEPGDATPSMAATWTSAKLTATPGATAIIYTMISEWPAVKAAIATLPPQMQSQVRYWIADPTGVPHVVPGSNATQWYWGKNYDISTADPGFQG